jgi:hypothetical protein
MGWAASRAWFTKVVGNLTDAKPVLAWGMLFLLIGAFCAIMVVLAMVRFFHPVFGLHSIFAIHEY